MKTFQDFLTEQTHPYTLKAYKHSGTDKTVAKGETFHVMTNHRNQKVGMIVRGSSKDKWRLHGHKDGKEYDSVEAAAHALHHKNLKMFKD